jgi:hypothetical protein
MEKLHASDPDTFRAQIISRVAALIAPSLYFGKEDSRSDTEQAGALLTQWTKITGVPWKSMQFLSESQARKFLREHKIGVTNFVQVLARSGGLEGKELQEALSECFPSEYVHKRR